VAKSFKNGTKVRLDPQFAKSEIRQLLQVKNMLEKKGHFENPQLVYEHRITKGFISGF
jgi:hypothetical protein